MSRFLTTAEVADLCRTAPETVRYWRYIGSGPTSFKVGRRVLYAEDDVYNWLTGLRGKEDEPIEDLSTAFPPPPHRGHPAGFLYFCPVPGCVRPYGHTEPHKRRCQTEGCIRPDHIDGHHRFIAPASVGPEAKEIGDNVAQAIREFAAERKAKK